MPKIIGYEYFATDREANRRCHELVEAVSRGDFDASQPISRRARRAYLKKTREVAASHEVLGMDSGGQDEAKSAVFIRPRLSGDSEVKIFRDDRSDVAWRTYPRMVVGTLVLCSLITVGIYIALGIPPLPTIFPAMLQLATISLLLRFDVLKWQVGRRVRYEMSDNRLVAYRGSKSVAEVCFSDVVNWIDARPAETFRYWIVMGYLDMGRRINSLPRYSFTISEGNGKTKEITLPPLFRWEDRGGLEDVTLALTERLGEPVAIRL